MNAKSVPSLLYGNYSPGRRYGSGRSGSWSGRLTAEVHLVMRLFRMPGVFAVMLLLQGTLHSQQIRPLVEKYVADNQRKIVTELVELLSIPNVAADRANVRRNAELLQRMFTRRGFTVELLETNGNPLVLAEMKAPGATRTLLLYAHYDGQPIDPKGWKQENAFKPVLRAGRLEDGAAVIPDLDTRQTFLPEQRIYARSASDDKAPIVAILAAVDALKASSLAPTSNIKVILDGEEEAGSEGLQTSMDRYKEKYRADLMIILDGPEHSSGRPTLMFGARGNLILELTVYGPKFALHSGHYGNWAPNPAMDLAQLLASMKDDRGRVIVEGFYDDVPPLSAAEKAALADVPDNAEELKRFFGISRTDAVGGSLQEALQFPSLNVRGLRSAYVGADARTIIPDTAIAAIDVRLVKETDPDRMAQRVIDHIRKQGFHIVDTEPDDAVRARYPRIVRVDRDRATRAFRTEMSIPESRAMIAALERAWGRPPVRVRTMGGTVPIDFFIQALGFPAISLPVVNFDNNQHSENENLKLDNLWRAIVSLAAVLRM